MYRDTTTGLKFEKLAQVEMEGEKIDKYNFYSFLKDRNVNWKNYVSRRLLPDDAYYIPKENKVVIYEKKFQKSEGSADEKPQTCAFKILEYKKMLKPANIENVSLIYIFNDWFKKDKYKDMLEYIKSVPGCDYYFYEKEA